MAGFSPPAASALKRCQKEGSSHRFGIVSGSARLSEPDRRQAHEAPGGPITQARSVARGFHDGDGLGGLGARITLPESAIGAVRCFDRCRLTRSIPSLS
jgi:hypothetical protein